MYKNAQTYCGYYHPSIPAFNYNEKDLTLCIVFKTEVNALNFQTEFEFLGTNIFHSQLKTESEVTLIDKIILGKRIFLKDYESYEFGGPPEGSPDDSFLSESSSVYTEYSPTDDVVKYQSLEKINWLEFGSEGAHLVSKKTCLKRKNDSLNRSENNRLALSRQLHGFVDGLLNGRRPVVKLNYVPGKEEKVGLRYRVTVGVQFLSQRVRALVEPLLKEGSRNTDNPLVMECDVYVLDKDEFIESLIHKSNETNGIWNVLGY